MTKKQRKKAPIIPINAIRAYVNLVEECAHRIDVSPYSAMVSAKDIRHLLDSDEHLNETLKTKLYERLGYIEVLALDSWYRKQRLSKSGLDDNPGPYNGAG